MRGPTPADTHPYPNLPADLTEFVSQHMGVLDAARVAAVAAALAPVAGRVMGLVAVYGCGPQAFGPFREYRNKIWRLLVLSDPALDRAVKEAAGYKDSEPIT